MVLNRGKTSLNDPRLDVVGARAAVGGRRALVEGPRARRPALRSQRLREGVVLVPEREDSRSSAGRSTCGGRGGTRSRCLVLRLSTSVGRLTKGRGRPAAGPRGTTLLGADACCRRAPTRGSPQPVLPADARIALLRRSSGGSGVIFAPANTPGLSPSPGRCRLCSELLVPSTPCGRAQSARRRGGGHPGFRGRSAGPGRPGRGQLSGAGVRHILAAPCGLGHTRDSFTRMSRPADARGDARLDGTSDSGRLAPLRSG